MADLIFGQNTNDWVKLHLSIYVTSPDEFPTGMVVLENRTTGVPMLVSDGSATNVKMMSDSDLTTLIEAGKPPGYSAATKTLPADAPIYRYTRQKWASLIRAAREDRDRAQAAGADPLDVSL